MSARIYMDQSGDGRTIRYNLDKTTSEAAADVQHGLATGELVEIPHEDGGEPIFINPDKVVSITPIKEDSE